VVFVRLVVSNMLSRERHEHPIEGYMGFGGFICFGFGGAVIVEGLAACAAPSRRRSGPGYTAEP